MIKHSKIKIGLLFCSLLLAITTFSQSPYYPDDSYTKKAGLKVDGTFHFPRGTTPALGTKGWNGPGALFYVTADSSLSVYSGYNWHRQLSIKDTGVIATRAYAKTHDDSLGALIGAKISNITGYVTPGSNVSFTGSGTAGSPYVISSSGGGTLPDNWVDPRDFGAADNRHCAYAFLAAQATGKNVLLPRGRFIIDSTITLNNGQTMMGVSTDQVTLVTTVSGSISPFSSIFSIIKVVDNAQVRNIRFVGTGLSGTYNSGTVWTTQNGIHIQGSSNQIYNCAFDSLGGSGIFCTNSGLTTFYSNIIGSNRIRKCTIGLLNYTNSQYQLAVANDIDSCTIGLVEQGGNNKFVGGNIIWNGTGVLMTGVGPGHGLISSTSINHNTTALSITSLQNGYTFTDCPMWYGSWTISNCDQLQFIGCQIEESGNIAPTATSTTKAVTFANCQVGGTTSIKEGSGTAVVVQQGAAPINQPYYQVIAPEFRIDSSRLFIHGKTIQTSDSLLWIGRASSEALRVSGTSLITYVRRIVSANFTADGFTNFSYLNGGTLQLTGGVGVEGYQQPFQFNKQYITGGGLYGMYLRNDTALGAFAFPDSTDYYPLKIDFRSRAGDNVLRQKFAVNGAGSIYSAFTPHAAAQDTILVVEGGQYKGRTFAEVAAAIGASVGGAVNNPNVGTGYRWVKPSTQEIKTLFAGLYMLIDSTSNTNGLTPKIDTASMFPAIRATIPAGGGGGGSGTVTSIAAGYGELGGTITTTGTRSLDSATVFPHIRATLLSGAIPHSGLLGLTTGDDHTQYALLAGRSSGQTYIGSTGTTTGLNIRATSGVGTTGSNIIFQVGNNGATEAGRFDNSGRLGIGETSLNKMVTFRARSGNSALAIGAFSSSTNGSIDYYVPTVGTISTGVKPSLAWVVNSASDMGGTDLLTVLNSGLVGVGKTPLSNLDVNGSLGMSVRAITASRTLDATDHTIIVTANSITVTLPTAVGITGREYTIVNTGVGTVTMATTSGQTISGSAPTTATIMTVVSDGANWVRTDNSGSGSTYTGTANQVIVTGSVLSAPQDINTTSTPQFSRMGIGTASVSNTALIIGGTITGSGSAQGVVLTSTLNPTAGNTAIGFSVAPTFTEAASGTHGEFVSAFIQKPTITAGAGAVTNAYTLHVDQPPTASGANNLSLQVDGATRIDGTVAMNKGVSYGSTTTITDGATVTYDASAYSIAKVTLGGNRTLAITNAVAGQSFTLEVIQDGTGTRTLTLPGGSKVANGGGGALGLTTTAGAIDIVTVWYDGTTYFINVGKNYN